MRFKRGYIYDYEVKPGDVRPALIVSADFRSGDDILNVIVLYSNEKDVSNVLVGTCYYADPRAVSFAKACRFGEFICSATDCEMDELDEQIARYLGLKREVAAEKIAHAEPRNFAVELAEAKTEARVYKELFERLQGILAGCGKA